MRIEVKMGNAVEFADIPAETSVAVIEPSVLPQDTQQEEIVLASLQHPIGTKRLRDLVKPNQKIAIITSDMTRPVPSDRILPLVLEELEEVGVHPEDVTIYFALGSHRSHTEKEKEILVGKDVYQRYACLDRQEEVTRVGITQRGTPVDIDTRVVEADVRICIGNVEFHYFAGFSGGAKAIMPGMSTSRSISYNHRWMMDPRAHAGNLEDNPVRQDLEEACDMVGVDFIVNVVLNTHKEIIYAASGDVRLAHRDACAYLTNLYQSPIAEEADIVIVSQGGFPKDINLYQMQKALDNSQYAVKEGGIIIAVGSCKEGFGQKTFEEWMLQYTNPDEMISHLQEHFTLGGHKAAAIARVQRKARIYLVSDIDAAIVQKTFLRPFASLQEAFSAAVQELGEKSTVLVMPYGGSTLPILKKGY